MYYLMNRDIPLLLFDFEDKYIKVLNNQFLPYMLKDYVIDSNFSEESKAKKSMECIEVLKDFFCSRLLNLSRSGAKEILNVANLPQSLKTAERLKIAMACRGLSMADDFWVKDLDEQVSYENVCLRKRPLCSRSYDIAILQKHISATREELRPDLSSTGMFPKFWCRVDDKVELWKTDRTPTFINTRAEEIVSSCLDLSNVSHVKYDLKKKDDTLFVVSECFITDEYYFMSAEDYRDYLVHTGILKDIPDYLTDFANMVCIDYIFANTDRHSGNFGFLVNSETNEILRMAPLFDHNQALVADVVETDISELIYEPTDSSFEEAVKVFARFSNFKIMDEWSTRVQQIFEYMSSANNVNREACLKRFQIVEEYKRKQSVFMEQDRILSRVESVYGLVAVNYERVLDEIKIATLQVDKRMSR